MQIGKLCAAVLPLFVLMHLAAASAFGASSLAYRFQGMGEAVYNVTITADTPEAVETHTGTISYNIQAVDPANGQVRFGYNSQLNQRTERKAKENDRGGWPPRPHFPPMPRPPFPFQASQAAPEIMISQYGSVLRSNRNDDGSQLPYMLGHTWQLLVPPLPQDGAATWKEERDIAIYTKSGNQQQWPPPPPWERRAEERVDRPAHETVTYTLGQANGDQVNISRRYELATEEKAGAEPLTSQRGEGTIVFDRSAGLVRSLNMTYTIALSGDNIHIRVPVTVKATLLTEQELADLKAQREAAAADARAAAEKRQKQLEEQKQAQVGTMRTSQAGRTGGDNVLIEMPQRPVLGVRFTLGDWGGHKCIRSMQPLYEKPTGQPADGAVEYLARPGYAVSGAVVSVDKNDQLIWSVQLIFMRLENGRLVAKDQYRSPSVNPTGTLAQTTKVMLDGKGEPVFGFYVTQGLNVDGIGLILKDPEYKPDADTGETEPEAAQEETAAEEGVAKVDAEEPADEATDESKPKGGWQNATAKATELLPQMTGQVVKHVDGSRLLARGTVLTTAQSYRAPVTFRLVVQSDTKDFRIGYAANQIIFNWEMNADELRVDGGPVAGQHAKGAGRIPAGEWTNIEMVVRPTEMLIYVDGRQQYRARGNFSAVNQPFTIRAHNGDLKLKSISVVR